MSQVLFSSATSPVAHLSLVSPFDSPVSPGRPPILTVTRGGDMRPRCYGERSQARAELSEAGDESVGPQCLRRSVLPERDHMSAPTDDHSVESVTAAGLSTEAADV